MRKIWILMIVIIIALLTACGNKEKEVPVEEMTENEKLSVNIDREKSHYDEIHELINELEPEERKGGKDDFIIEEYEPGEFIRFILPEGWVNEVTRVIGEDEDGNKVETITIVYTYRDHSIVIKYYGDGSIRKAILNQETGYVLVNENDEEYMKFHSSEVE